MSKICNTCGLPSDLCICEDIAKESQRIVVQIEKKKFGKEYTVISGLNESEIDLKELAKKLKSKFACGGTAKDGKIELQGNHLQQTPQVLTSYGFSPETIDVKR
jgi:translation initiation factor 1